MTGHKVGNLVSSQYALRLECQAVWNLFKLSEGSGDPSPFWGMGNSMIEAADLDITQ